MAAPTFNPDFLAIGQQFVAHYYSKFDVPDANVRVQGLADLYDPDVSFMTFEGAQEKGRITILQKFAALTFRAIQHAPTVIDCQPLADGSILVVVLGQLKTDDDPPQSYTHTFLLRPSAAGSFFIANEIFRLVLHHK